MKIAFFLFFAAILACLAGCLPFSVNPIYTPETIITNPAIEGQWEDPGTDEKYVFLPLDSSSYKMILKKEGVITGIYRAYLLKLEESVYLDITPIMGTTYDEIYNNHIMKLHSFYRVEQIEPTLKISLMDHGWLKQYLIDNPTELDYFIQDETVILTSSTPKLQKFLIRHANTENAFGEASDIVKN
ncbi:MAG: hypothetical protein ABIJ45_02695 [Candidatus Zixiibacteriota bacterium]